MTYSILTPQGVIDYIQNTPTLTSYFDDDALAVSEIGDGNLNYIFLARSPQKSIIIKQSLPYLRCAGEDWKLSRHRIAFETKM